MGEEKLEFSRRFLILGNLGLLAWITLAAIGISLHNYLYGWLYFALLAFLTYGVLRRLGCSSCYVCKHCTGGFGRLAGAFFGRGFTKKASVGDRWPFVVVMYVLLLLIPAVLVLIPFILGEFSFVSLFVLVSLFALTIYSVLSWRPQK